MAARPSPNWLTQAEADALVRELDRRGEDISTSHRVRALVGDAMRAARIRPAMIYAYLHTGLLITETTRRILAPGTGSVGGRRAGLRNVEVVALTRVRPCGMTT